MSIGSNIRRRRLELRISQSELARAVGYSSRSAIANIESGKSELPASRVLQMAKALDTSVESLLSDLDPIGDINSDLHVRTGARNAAIVLAGGRSTRNMQNVPNQFVNVLGRPVISWCLEVYQRHPMIDDIVVVCLESWEDVVLAYSSQYGISKLRAVVKAGDSGVRSVKNGLDRLIESGYDSDDIVVIQESTRPLVSAEMVSKVLLQCRRTKSAVTCGPMADNVQFIQTDTSWTYVDRSRIVDLQSPDAHTVHVLQNAFMEAERQGIAMDENSCAMLLYLLGKPLNFCVGGRRNFKIIRQEDIAVFEALAASGRGGHRQ